MSQSAGPWDTTKALIESARYMAGGETPSEATMSFAENFAKDGEEKVNLYLMLSHALEAPNRAKQLIATKLQIYLLLYRLAYERTTPAEELHAAKVLREILEQKIAFVRKMAPELAEWARRPKPTVSKSKADPAVDDDDSPEAQEWRRRTAMVMEAIERVVESKAPGQAGGEEPDSPDGERG